MSICNLLYKKVWDCIVMVQEVKVDSFLRLHWTQIQKLVGASKQTVYRWMDDGTLKYEQLKKGRLITITQLELDKLIDDFKAGMYHDVLNQSEISNVMNDTVSETYQDNNEIG